MDSRHGFHVPVGRVTTSDGVQFRFVVPGVPESDLRLWVEEGSLVLSGRRMPPAGAHRRSDLALDYGQFLQREPLPDGVDAKAMRIDIHHGLVDVFLPYAHEPADTIVWTLPVLPRATALALPLRHRCQPPV